MSPSTRINNTGGFVYVLTNESFPNLVKIGMTTQDNVEKRVRQMSTGVPTPFTIAYMARVNKPAEIEKALHKNFDSERYSKNREWFEVAVEDVQQKIWEFDSAVRYKDCLFSAIPEYFEYKENVDSKGSKFQNFVIIGTIFSFAFLMWFSTEDLISTIFTTVPMSFIIYLILKAVIFSKVNRYLYKDDLISKKVSIAKKYNVKADDIDTYQEHYFQEKMFEQRKAYRRMKKLSNRQ